MNKIIILAFLLSVFLSPAKAQITWQQVESGVWKGVVGTPEEYSLLDVSGAKPLKEGFSRLPEVALPALANEITATIQDGETYLRIPLQKKEQLYGFGLNFQTVHQRGKILDLHVDHYGGKDNGRTHAPVPFYVSSLGYGVFINSARYLTVYAGSNARKDSPNAPIAKDRNTDKTWTSKPYSDEVSILVPALGTEIYLFAGPTPMNVVQRYNLFCGGGALPPRWGLGFTQRTKTSYTTEDVKREIAEFEEQGYPLDFIGLEPGWQSKAYPCTFEWDKGRFPDPVSLIKELKDKGVRINLWTNPYVSPESSIYKSMYPLSGSHTVWCGIVPDFASKEARELWKSKLENDHVKIGASGYKIDEVDGYDRYLWPDVATFPSGVSAEQMRQTYGLWVQRITTDIYRKCNQRTYGLVRASNAGASAFPYVIYNDYYSHQDFITALINSGFCGVLWTPEVRGSKSAEEWLRRIQSVVFSPMAMINAWSSGTKPWSFPEVAEQVKEYATLRMRMMPYWYTAFARYHFDGIPPFRAINLEPGFNPEQSATSGIKNFSLEDNPYLEAISHEIKDQYMAGEYLLVAPLFNGQKDRTVILPQGNWYDFYTGKYVGNGEKITVTPGLDRIPVFVKDGAILPFMEAMLHAPKAGQKVNLEIRHYGKADGFYRLYDDDGETFNYEQGDYSWREIKVIRDKNGILKGTISKAEKGKPDNIASVTWKFMTKETEERMDEMWGNDKVNAQSKVDSRIMDEGNYGMFIHWGMYSELANRYKGKTYYGIGEWLMRKGMADIPAEEYMRMVSLFNPDAFDAQRIARLAKDAGMRHVIVTSKHHDGFAMFDSKVDDFTIVKATSFKRDPLKELADACRAEGLGFGFYYSHNQDWTYPGGRNGPSVNKKGEKKTFEDYLKTKCLPQIEELTTNYGQIDFMWFDTPGPMTEEEVEQVVAKVRKNQPKALISGRVGQGKGDYQTLGDMEVPHANASGLWESPDTSNDAWGYAWYDENWKTPQEVLQRLISCVARGGTYLLNIGPDGKGIVPERNVRVLKAVGRWIERYPQVIRAAGASPYGRALPWGDVTMHDKKMYLSVYKWPKDGKLYLYGLKTPVKRVRLLGEKETEVTLSWENKNDWMTINVPTVVPDKLVSVIELELESNVKVDSTLWPVDPDTDTRLLMQFADVVQAKKEKRSWDEKFGEWKKVIHVTDWMPGGKACIDVHVQKPGDYVVYLDYRGEGRLVWEVSIEGGESIRNQQGSSDYYQEFPIGWIRFPKAGKWCLSVSCLEGDLKKACLRAIKISPVIGI